MALLPYHILLLTLIPASQLTTLKILNTPDNLAPNSSDCLEAVICSGVSLHQDPTHPIYSWWDSSFYRGRVGKRVDMTRCGFVSTAVVTTTSRTREGDSRSCPGLFTDHVNTASFNVYSVEELSAVEIRRIECDVHWIATGYSNCS